MNDAVAGLPTLWASVVKAMDADGWMAGAGESVTGSAK